MSVAGPKQSRARATATGGRRHRLDPSGAFECERRSLVEKFQAHAFCADGTPHPEFVLALATFLAHQPRHSHPALLQLINSIAIETLTRQWGASGLFEKMARPELALRIFLPAGALRRAVGFAAASMVVGNG